MNSSELEPILGTAVRNVAARIGMENSAYYSVEELRDWIKEHDRALSECLEAFINAYWQWYDFHRRVEAQGKQGYLDADESQQLAGLVRKRNDTRHALFNSLPN